MCRDPCNLKNGLCCRLCQRPDALGAKRLLDQVALFQNADLLQIRFELAVGGVLGERALMSEHGRLTAVSAFSHRRISFLTMIPKPVASFEGTAFYHTSQPSSRQDVK
jgi:hypothetical protein